MLTGFQESILAMVAGDASVEAVADRICRQAASTSKGALCSIVTVDRSGLLHPLAGPDLPDSYASALDGIAIGPEVGSCGSAISLRQPVTVTDIFNDHRWAPYRGLAGPIGAKACWSSPILAGDGRALGAFGFYYRDHRGPNADEERIVAECTSLSAIILGRKEAQADHFRLTYQDALTGLGNRMSFEVALQASLNSSVLVGLLLFDINRLKRINRDFGHRARDCLVREVGRRIREEVRSGDAFRTGDGEFAVVVAGDSTELAMQKIAARIQATMIGAIHCDGHFITPSVSCAGALLAPDRFRDYETLYRQAVVALGHAKERLPGALVLFDDRMVIAKAQHTQQLKMTAQALIDERLEAHYQPIIRLGTREVVGLEALCRIRSPEGQILQPGDFLSALNAPATAALITDRMLTLVARDMRRWLDLGVQLQFVAVNVSAEDFQSGDLYERIFRVLIQHDVSPELISLEVTEAVDLERDNRQIVEAIERLRARGMLIALDDFGTGYASLTHLLEVPADIIKTDKSLMSRFHPGEGGELLIKALLDVAKGLGKRVLVEGVETSEQAERLKHLGCDLAQGFLFGRPSDVEATTAILLQAGKD